MAEVYRAYHKRLDRYVAIKVLHDFLADDPEFKDRFEKEARNIARLRHAHIVQVYDFEYDQENDSYYMVMELVNGETLKDRLYELGKPLDLEETLRIIREAASALAYAHRAGMIHRDVKPANLMIDKTEEDRVVLTDFGIAKLLTSSQFTVTGGLIGTPAYMAPEQGVGESGDERSDLYSLGVIFYQMLTGRLPYDAETPLALILKHLNNPIPSAREHNLELPETIDAIIERVLAKELEDRYQTADEFIEDIRLLENGTPLPPFATQELPAVPAELATQQDTPKQPPEQTPQAETDTPAQPDLDERQSTGRAWMWVLLFILIIGGAGAGYVFGAANGTFPAVAFLASETPLPTVTATATTTPTATATATATPSATNTSTATATATTTATTTPTAMEAPTNTAVALVATTVAPPTETPTITPNASETRAVQLTETIAACTFDYAITDQEPSDGAEGPEVPTNTEYQREITFLNTGNCAWEVNSLLAFVEGESFNAGPRIVIREEVPVDEEITITFDGVTPSRGRTEGGQLAPVEGTWQLRTRGQLAIGPPFTIGVLVYDPGF